MEFEEEPSLRWGIARLLDLTMTEGGARVYLGIFRLFHRVWKFENCARSCVYRSGAELTFKEGGQHPKF